MTDFGLSRLDGPLLLCELAHRVSNEFASIISTISRAAARSAHPEVKAALNEAMETLHGYVDVHRALKMPPPDTPVDAAEYLQRLCGVVSRSKLNQTGVDLMFNSAPLTLGSEHAWYLGLIVYELITNAMRHAFANRRGEVRVELRCADDLVECKVRDNGSAMSNFRRGQGLSIVARLANELGGTVQQQFAPNGSRLYLPFQGVRQRS
jgi:two-component sensor histidine kinase